MKRRRSALDAFGKKAAVQGQLIISPYTRDREQAKRWLMDFGRGATDGVVAKRLDGPYEPGKRAMIKVKRLRTADCVVGGFRYESKSREVGSLLLGLYDTQGKLDHVGFTSTITDDAASLIGTPEQKRELIAFVFSNLRLRGKKLEYSLRSPFDLMVNWGRCYT